MTRRRLAPLAALCLLVLLAPLAGAHDCREAPWTVDPDHQVLQCLGPRPPCTRIPHVCNGLDLAAAPAPVPLHGLGPTLP